jgi:hypothetical protein
MSSQLKKLAECFKLVNQLAASRRSQNPIFQEVAQYTQTIANDLNTGKLKIEVFSSTPDLAQGISNFFRTRQKLPQFYQFIVSEFPSNLQPIQTNQTPTLTLQANSSISQPEFRQELRSNQNILIGRDRQRLREDYRNQNSILLDLPMYSQVSSIHAEISQSKSTYSTWQVCDLNSRNGTYINGQKINACHPLNSGDRVTLVYPSPSGKCPAFIFEAPSITATNLNSSPQSFNSDFVCLVINPQKPLSEQEKQLIDKVSKSPVFALLIIADISTVNNQIAQQFNANLAAINNWLQVQYPRLSFEVTPLLLHPFYPNATNNTLAPNLQQQYEQFCEPLVLLGKTKAEEILLKRLTPQLINQINRLDQFFSDQSDSLRDAVQRTEEKLQGHTVEECRGQLGRVFKRVGEEREEFFRQARRELSDSKTNLINNFSQFSLLYRIEGSISEFHPVVTREAGQVCLKLQTVDGTDGHQAATQFVQTELSQWVETEWQRIADGINRLIQSSYATLNCIPSFSLSNSFNYPAQQVDIQSILQDSFVARHNSVSYYEGSAKQDLVNGAVRVGIQGMAVAGMVGVTMASGNPFPMMALMQGSSIASSLMGLVGNTLTRPQIQKLKLEEFIAKLRDQGCRYYQSLAEFLANRLVQEMSSALDTEERRFKRSLDTIDEQFVTYLTELKKHSEGYRVQQQNLEREKATFEQIKRLLI